MAIHCAFAERGGLIKIERKKETNKQKRNKQTKKRKKKKKKVHG